MRKILPFFLLLLLISNTTWAQPQPTPKERAVQLSATVQTNPPQINLQWVPDFGGDGIYRLSESSK